MKRSLKVLGACAAGGGVLAYTAYRKELDAANKRIENGRHIGPIEYAEAGEGVPALLVHGAGGGFDQGLALGVAFLGDGYRIVAPSRFGYLGTPLPANASPGAQADAHLRLLDALQLDCVPVIGVSAGGPSALQLALRHPDRCSALTLVVPMAWAPERGAGTARLSPLFVPVLNAIASSDLLFWTAMNVAKAALVKTILGTPVAVYSRATREERHEVDRMLRLILPISKRVTGIWNDSEVAMSLTRAPLEEMRVPTLVISAADDLYDTYESGRYTAEQIPGGRFLGFPTGGHLLVGREAEVRSEITTFLRACVVGTQLSEVVG